MANIKTRNSISKKTIKTLNKSLVFSEKTKDSLVDIKDKAISTSENEQNEFEYGSNKINDIAGYSSNILVNGFIESGPGSVNQTKHNIIKLKNKRKLLKEKMKYKKALKKEKKAVKTSKEVVKKTKRVTKETVKNSQRTARMIKNAAKKTIKALKVSVKVSILTIKNIINGTKALVSALIAGGWLAVVIIILVCMIGLLCSSVFGIFFSSEKTSESAITMKDVVAECNKEFTDKLLSIQNQNPHEDYILEGSMASWKDILIVYAIKQSNGVNQTDVVTVDNNKKKVVKQIFWDMNILSSEVKAEIVTEQGVNSNEQPKQVQKKVLHIKIDSKTLEQMKIEYHFNTAQNKQLEELSSNKYSNLWNGVIYGSNNSGKYINWRQNGASWSNIRIGNTTSTIGDIGCLVTSIAILIEKSGVNTSLKPFNPGTFVEALNKNGGFDGGGNLQYNAINRVVPNFKYVGKVNLRGKSRDEKLSLITKYYNSGYYITAEVKGATPGNQHWVAVIGVDGNSIIMVDPGSNQTNMWNAYEYSNTSQFNYFKEN